MNDLHRIRSFARSKVPRTILTHLLDGEFYYIDDLCNFANDNPFYIRTVRYWVKLLVEGKCLQVAFNLQKDGRKRIYRIPPEMMETVEELLRRVPEDECQRL